MIFIYDNKLDEEFLTEGPLLAAAAAAAAKGVVGTAAKKVGKTAANYVLNKTNAGQKIKDTVDKIASNSKEGSLVNKAANATKKAINKTSSAEIDAENIEGELKNIKTNLNKDLAAVSNKYTKAINDIETAITT